MYGLRTKTDEAGKRRITRPLFQSPDSIMELPAAVQSTMPEPFLRALHSTMAEELEMQTRPVYDPQTGQQIIQKHDQQEATNTPQKTAEPDAQHPKPFDNLMQFMNRPREIKDASALQLITDVEPGLKLTPNVTEEQISASDRLLLADFLLADCFTELQDLVSRPVPNFIIYFNQIILGGGADTTPNGKPMVSLDFYLLSADGKQLQKQTGGTYFPRVSADTINTTLPHS